MRAFRLALRSWIAIAAMGAATGEPGVLAGGAAAGPDLPPPAELSEPGGPAPGGAASTGTTRRDLAASYMRFDRLFMGADLSPRERTEMHRAFDAATVQFFSGNMAAVVSAVDELARRLSGGDLPRSEVSYARLDPAERATVDARIRLLLGKQPPADSRLATPWGIARARASVLGPEGTEFESARFLLDEPSHAAAVTRELEALVNDTNPYRGLVGEVWRPIVLDGATVPCRVYSPRASSEEPRALVIALHGAGGDEAMFLHAYGAGQIKTIADEHGFLVASPSTYQMMGNGPLFDALVEQLSADYAIDPDRVYVVGHSLGGGAAVMLASLRGPSLAGAVGICGGTAIRKGAAPCPVLIIGAEFDPIVPAGGLRRMVERSTQAGHDVTYREHAGGGHTLTVNEVLRDAINWLLERKRRGAPESRAK